MKVRKLALSPCVAFALAACSGGGSQDANRTSAANEAAPTTAAVPQASPELLARVVDCQATFDAVAGLYSAMGSVKSGTERDELMAAAGRRRQIADALRARAMSLGGTLGVAPADVQARLGAARERLRAESQVGDFSEFAGQVGRRADICTRGMSELM